MRRASLRSIVTALAIAAAAWLGGCDNEKNAFVPPPPPRVAVAQAAQQATTVYLQLTGNTAAYNQVDLVARVQGYLTAINYQDGALVKKGDVLFQIEPDQYKAAVDQANANVQQAQATLVNANAEFSRQSQLARQDFAAQAKVDQTRAARDEAQAQVLAAEASVQTAGLDLGYTQVAAPFDGIVTAHLVDVGALVGYGSPTKLASIVALDPIYVWFNVSETDVLRIRQSLRSQGKTLADLGPITVEVGTQTEDGYPHSGTLDYVAPEVDQSTGTLLVRAVFENGKRGLLPGLFVRVRVATQKLPSALLVADTAFGTNQQGEYLLVLGPDDVVVQQQVKTGQSEGGLRIVTDGIRPEDWIVVGGVQRAIPGSKVAPDRGPMPTPTTEAALSPPAAPAAKP